MNTKLRQVLLIAALCSISVTASTSAPSEAKKKTYTVYDRQVELRKKVQTAQKANELTAKEADKLNHELSDIDTDIEKMKSKNDGKLSYKDEGKVEKRLNKVSLSLQKYQLAKRVTAH